MLLAGVWYSKDKPTMTTFLKPIVEEINSLYTQGKVFHAGVFMEDTFMHVSPYKGLVISTPDGKQTLLCVLLMCAVDLPARAIVLNMKQYNGMYGCSFCYDTGKTKIGSPLHRFWPPQSVTPALRTHQSVHENAIDATTTKLPVI